MLELLFACQLYQLHFIFEECIVFEEWTMEDLFAVYCSFQLLTDVLFYTSTLMHMLVEKKIVDLS